LVAKVCSQYIQYCERGVAQSTLSEGHLLNTKAFLNELCGYCGAVHVSQLKKGHVEQWIGRHKGRKSPATRRSVLSIVLAAFNYARDNYHIVNPIKGLKKPSANPRLHSLSDEDEQAVYGATDTWFGNFVFVAIRTGLRPFCELARVTADDVEENDRGMMWRVYSSKTKKTRKIPVRPEVAELTRTLIENAPVGSGIPLFLNAKGTGWTKVAGVRRFCTIKRKLGWDQDPIRNAYSSYSVNP